MVSIASTSSTPARQVDVAKSGSNLEVKATTSAEASSIASSSATKSVSDGVTISTFSGRLSKAADHTTARLRGLDNNGLRDQINVDVKKIFYDFDDVHKTLAASEVPEPSDDTSVKSATSAIAFLAGKGPNPFAGLPRDQLATIAHDESGAFTMNERRAAFTQARQEEQAWRSQVVAEGIREYNESGKMTNFFQSVLDHFEGLPDLEKATYTENYADDLREKIKLNFNYINHSAGNAGPTPDSIADIRKNMKSNDVDLFKFMGMGSDTSISF